MLLHLSVALIRVEAIRKVSPTLQITIRLSIHTQYQQINQIVWKLKTNASQGSRNLIESIYKYYSSNWIELLLFDFDCAWLNEKWNCKYWFRQKLGRFW